MRHAFSLFAPIRVIRGHSPPAGRDCLPVGSVQPLRGVVPGIRDSIFWEDQRRNSSSADLRSFGGSCGQRYSFRTVSTSEVFRKVCQIRNHFRVRDCFACESREWTRMRQMRICVTFEDKADMTIGSLGYMTDDKPSFLREHSC